MLNYIRLDKSVQTTDEGEKNTCPIKPRDYGGAFLPQDECEKLVR